MKTPFKMKGWSPFKQSDNLQSLYTIKENLMADRKNLINTKSFSGADKRRVVSKLDQVNRDIVSAGGDLNHAEKKIPTTPQDITYGI